MLDLITLYLSLLFFLCSFQGATSRFRRKRSRGTPWVFAKQMPGDNLSHLAIHEVNARRKTYLFQPQAKPEVKI